VSHNTAAAPLSTTSPGIPSPPWSRRSASQSPPTRESLDVASVLETWKIPPKSFLLLPNFFPKITHIFFLAKTVFKMFSII
jgi:hypothetical protein